MKNLFVLMIGVVVLSGCETSLKRYTREAEIAFGNGKPVAILTDGDSVIGDPEASYAFGIGKAFEIYRPLGNGKVAKYSNSAKQIITYTLNNGIPIAIGNRAEIYTEDSAMERIDARSCIGYTPLTGDYECQVSITPIGLGLPQMKAIDEAILHARETHRAFFENAKTGS